MVGARGFEPPTTTTPRWCATRLRYAPCVTPVNKWLLRCAYDTRPSTGGKANSRNGKENYVEATAPPAYEARLRDRRSVPGLSSTDWHQSARDFRARACCAHR